MPNDFSFYEETLDAGKLLNYFGREYLNAITWVSHFHSPEFHGLGVLYIHPSRINAYNYCLQYHNTSNQLQHFSCTTCPLNNEYAIHIRKKADKEKRLWINMS